MATKYVFFTGGVVSGLGKGISASSLAALMEALQGLTADRIPDLPTAFSGTAGALTGPSWQRYLQRC